MERLVITNEEWNELYEPKKMDGDKMLVKFPTDEEIWCMVWACKEDGTISPMDSTHTLLEYEL